jgi:hypothetical protein
MSTGASRRYLALLARAKDQAGTPEGDTCRSMADAMLASCPSLAVSVDTLPFNWDEYKYADPWEHDLLLRIGEYLDIEPKRWAKSRRKVLLFLADVPTHAAIRQTFAVLGRRMREVLTYAFAGFQAGALPLPRRERDDTDDDDAPEPDPELLELAMSARSFGSASQPRKALR